MFGKLFGKKEKEENKNEMTAEINSVQPEATIAPTEDKPKEVTKEEKPKEQSAPLTYKEMKSLQKARYEEIMDNPKFKKAYLLKNIKTGQMAEIRAASSFHACNIIGWKKNQVKVVSEKVMPEKAPETSNAKEVKKVDVPETTSAS